MVRQIITRQLTERPGELLNDAIGAACIIGICIASFYFLPLIFE